MSATTRAAAAGRGGRRRLPLPLRRGVRRAASPPATSSSTPSYSGRRYGTLRSELERRTAAGDPVVLEIEVQGARQVREAMPEAVQVFIAPPSREALRARLVGRGTDAAEEVERAPADRRARSSRPQDEFAHVVVNDRLERRGRASWSRIVRELDRRAGGPQPATLSGQ